MRLAQLGVLFFGVTLALVAFWTPSHAVPQCEISAIAPPPGYVEFYPTAINDAGQVVGTASDAETGLERAVVWRNGTSIQLGSLSGTCSRGSAINDVGQVVGDSCTGTTADETHAFVWDGVFMVDLGLTGRESGAEGVNAAGLVVGYERDSLGNAHAMLWERGEGHRLVRFESGFSKATRINDLGQIVFWAMTSGAGGSAESYLSENGSLSYVGAFEATGINGAGQVIGYRATPLLDLRGLLWQAGASRDIGIPDDRVLPRVINNAGQVVGSMWRNGYSERAFVWEDGLTRDLNDTIPTDTGWELRRATGLNNMGQIVGYGKQDGEERAFIVTRES